MHAYLKRKPERRISYQQACIIAGTVAGKLLYSGVRVFACVASMLPQVHLAVNHVVSEVSHSRLSSMAG